MPDVTKYGGTGGSDFPGARKPIEDASVYDGATGPRATTELLYGDAEDPADLDMSGLKDAVDWSDALPQVQDILDETTTLTSEGLFYLSGENLVNHMSAVAPWCLATEQMNIVAEDADWGTGWIFKVVTGNDAGTSAAVSYTGGIALTKLSVNSIYVDPDQDKTVATDGLAQYGEMGVPPPPLLTPRDAGDSYGNAAYVGGVYDWSLAEREFLALQDKFGYTAGSGDLPADTYGAVFARIGGEIDALIEMLQVGYSTRQNISRSTPRINIFDNFEAISAVENEEPIDESTTGVRTSTMITDTGDYDS